MPTGGVGRTFIGYLPNEVSSDEGLEMIPTFASVAKMAMAMRRAASPFITCETKRPSVMHASAAMKCFQVTGSTARWRSPAAKEATDRIKRHRLSCRADLKWKGGHDIARSDWETVRLLCSGHKATARLWVICRGGWACAAACHAV